MARHPRRRGRSGPALKRPNPVSTPVIRQDAAGIDIGATELWVAVPPARDPEPVRCFETFTDSLRALVDWLRHCGVKTVAMESTGVYWIPVFQALETAGFEVCLVNARHFKNVDGRKTDVLDCQWLQHCHSVGLLRASFRPADEVVALRAVVRHRAGITKMATMHVQHIHKALTQMNVQVHHVLSDITGSSGLAILDAILGGHRDPHHLAKLCDPRVKAPEERIARSLEGDWRPEHLFTLRQSLAAYRHCLHQMAECDSEIQRMIGQMEAKHREPTEPGGDHPVEHPSVPAHRPLKRHCSRRQVDEFTRLFGSDLTQVDGFSAGVLNTLLSEVGYQLGKFPTDKQFGSWLGIAPNSRITGGRLLSSGTRSVASRAAWAFRMAAQTLWRSETLLGQCFRRLRARLGTPKAITAMAYKLARIFYHLVKSGKPYDDSQFAEAEAKYQERKKARILDQARNYGYELVPIPGVS